MPVAEGVVHAVDRRPVLVCTRRTGGKDPLLPAVGTVPLTDEVGHGVGCVLERVVRRVAAAVFDRTDFFADRQHGVAEAIQLSEALAFGGFDHQRPRHRPAHGRGMKTAVHQPLGDVLDRNPGAGFEGPGVDDALVRHAARRPLEQDLERAFQPGRDVVGVEDGDARSLCQPLPAHHHHVGIGNREDRRRAQRRGADRADRPFALRVTGQMLGEVRLDPDRPHAGTAAAVGDGEGLVQVQVADIAAQIARPRQADHGVHVGTIDIDLPAELVGDRADLPHRFFEHAVGRRIGDHAPGKLVGVGFGLGAEIVEIDVTVFSRSDRHHAPADHLRRGGVGAVGAHGDQAHPPLILTARAVVAGDGQQPGILALRARVGLHGKGVVAGDHAQPLGQGLHEALVACGLLHRSVRVQAGKLRPADRHHLGGGIKLHRAGAQRDHRPVQRQITVGEATHVAHHLGLRPVHMEDFVIKIG